MPPRQKATFADAREWERRYFRERQKEAEACRHQAEALAAGDRADFHRWERVASRSQGLQLWLAGKLFGFWGWGYAAHETREVSRLHASFLYHLWLAVAYGRTVVKLKGMPLGDGPRETEYAIELVSRLGITLE